jgi:hypothetical protein
MWKNLVGVSPSLSHSNVDSYRGMVRCRDERPRVLSLSCCRSFHGLQVDDSRAPFQLVNNFLSNFKLGSDRTNRSNSLALLVYCAAANQDVQKACVTEGAMPCLLQNVHEPREPWPEGFERQTFS